MASPEDTGSRKGQMEIMGLVFIVILVVMGLLLLLLFIGKGQPTLKRFTESALAYNYLTTLGETRTACRDYAIDDLLRECAAGAAFNCENGQDPCRYSEDTINEILSKTLTAWNRNYSLAVSTGDASLMAFGLLKDGRRCPGDIEGAFYRIPFAGANIVMNLSLCA
jgi:hypothetical protein